MSLAPEIFLIYTYSHACTLLVGFHDKITAEIFDVRETWPGGMGVRCHDQWPSGLKLGYIMGISDITCSVGTLT